MGANETRFRDSWKDLLWRPSTGNFSIRPSIRAATVAWAMCAAMLLTSLLLSSCGGGSSSSSSPPPPPTSNTVGLAVDAGPTGSCTNCLFTNVTVCVPGTATCQVIDHVLVDTGSYGLRLVSSGAAPAGGELTLSLTQQTKNGTPIAECVEFADSITWGPVSTVDVEIAGEKATSVPIQVIGDPSESIVPNTGTCGGSGLPVDDDVSRLGANGILGIGVFVHDCGSDCVGSTTNDPYYACPTQSTCAVTTEPLDSQVQNPVALFSTDNNGLSISLPSVPNSGSATVSGTLTFGIGTQSDNGLGNAMVFPVDGFGNFITEYKGTQYPMSFIDSGSGAIFYLDSATTGITGCPSPGPDAGLYCPAGAVAQTATNLGAGGSPSNTVDFTVENAGTLLSSPSFAFSTLAGTNPNSVDWGMPFFYGRTVFVAINGQVTPAGSGPYWAY